MCWFVYAALPVGSRFDLSDFAYPTVCLVGAWDAVVLDEIGSGVATVRRIDVGACACHMFVDPNAPAAPDAASVRARLAKKHPRWSQAKLGRAVADSLGAADGHRTQTSEHDHERRAFVNAIGAFVESCGPIGLYFRWADGNDEDWGTTAAGPVELSLDNYHRRSGAIPAGGPVWISS